MERINWDVSGYSVRIAVVELCGWCNKRGNATPTGKKIARQSWETMSTAARNVLTQHGINQ